VVSTTTRGLPGPLGRIGPARAVRGTAPDHADEGLEPVVVEVAPPGEPDPALRDIGDRPVHDVLAVVQARHGHRDDDDPCARRHRLDRLLHRHRRRVDAGALTDLGGHLGPLGHLRRVLEEMLVGEVGDAHLVGSLDVMLLRHDHDRHLAVERDHVQPVPVDRQTHEAHVRAAVVQHRHLLGLLDQEELERHPRHALCPHPCPLVGRDAGDETDAQGTGPPVGGVAHVREASPLPATLARCRSCTARAPGARRGPRPHRARVRRTGRAPSGAEDGTSSRSTTQPWVVRASRCGNLTHPAWMTSAQADLRDIRSVQPTEGTHAHRPEP
jgi:hypothetical protein